MNAQPDSTTIATAQAIVFEPTGAGGGSWWDTGRVFPVRRLRPERMKA